MVTINVHSLQCEGRAANTFLLKGHKIIRRHHLGWRNQSFGRTSQKKSLNCTHFRHPTDEQLRHVDVYLLATKMICSLSTLNYIEVDFVFFLTIK